MRPAETLTIDFPAGHVAPPVHHRCPAPDRAWNAQKDGSRRRPPAAGLPAGLPAARGGTPRSTAPDGRQRPARRPP